jgi:hypothetical protein
LFIGNSQFAVQNLPMIVASLSQSGHLSCPRIEATYAYADNLRSGWATPSIRESIASRRFSDVVLAESIDLIFPQDAGYPRDSEPNTRLFVDAIRQAGARPLLYATPSIDIATRVEDFRNMAQPQLDLGRALGVTVATGGLAWLRVWQQLPNLDLFSSDRQHPGYLGAVLSGLVLFAALNDTTPEGLSAMPATDFCGNNCTPISASLAALFQRAAWDEYLTNGRR